MKNRPLIFRAYDTKEKKWLFDYETLGGFSMFGELHIMDELRIEQLDNIAVMQYTGLKDKLGKEIYEGDILELGIKNYFDSVNYDKGYVYYKNEYTQFRIQRIGKEYKTFSSELDEGRDVKIIGNVFDNPSLLT